MEEIGRRCRVDPKTAKKAVVWGLEVAGRPMGATTRRAFSNSKCARIAADVQRLSAEGHSLAGIARELGVAVTTAKKALRHGPTYPTEGAPLYQRLAEEAVSLRKRGLSVRQVAEELGVSTSTAEAAISWGHMRGRRRKKAEHSEGGS